MLWSDYVVLQVLVPGPHRQDENPGQIFDQDCQVDPQLPRVSQIHLHFHWNLGIFWSCLLPYHGTRIQKYKHIRRYRIRYKIEYEGRNHL